MGIVDQEDPALASHGHSFALQCLKKRTVAPPIRFDSPTDSAEELKNVPVPLAGASIPGHGLRIDFLT